MFRRVGAGINFLIKRFKGKIDKQDVENEFYINSIKSFPKWLKRRNVISFLSIIENYFYIPNWWCFYIILRPEYSLLPRRLYIIPLLKYSLKKKNIYILQRNKDWIGYSINLESKMDHHRLCNVTIRYEVVEEETWIKNWMEHLIEKPCFFSLLNLLVIDAIYQ